MSTENKKSTNSKFKSSLITFLVCLFTASLIWLFSVLSKEYTLTLTYRLSCVDIPENKRLTGQSDSSINLVFHTRGFNYLNPKYADRNRVLYISVNTITQNSTKRNVYTFNKTALNSYIRSQNAFSNDFVEVESPESLTVYLK